MKSFIMFLEFIITSNYENTFQRAYKQTGSFLKNAKNKVEDVLRPSKIGYTKLKDKNINLLKPRSVSDGQISFTVFNYKLKKDINKNSITDPWVKNEIKLQENSCNKSENLNFNKNMDSISLINIKIENYSLFEETNFFNEKIIHKKDKDIINIKKNENLENNNFLTDHQLLDYIPSNSKNNHNFDSTKTIEFNKFDTKLSLLLNNFNSENFFFDKEFKLEITRNELIDYKKKLKQFDHNILLKTENGYVDMTSKIIKTFLLKINKNLITCYTIHHYLILSNYIHYPNISEKLKLEKFKQQYDKALNEFISGKSLTINLVYLETNINTNILILNKIFKYFTLKNNNKIKRTNYKNKDFILSKDKFEEFKNVFDDDKMYVEML